MRAKTTMGRQRGNGDTKRCPYFQQVIQDDRYPTANGDRDLDRECATAGDAEVRFGEDEGEGTGNVTAVVTVGNVKRTELKSS